MKIKEIGELTIDQLRDALANKNEGVGQGCSPEPITTQIVVLDRGFVYVGEPEFSEDGDFLTLTNARNIRVWGTTKGLGELVDGPTSKTVLDDVGTILVPVRAIIHLIKCKKNW